MRRYAPPIVLALCVWITCVPIRAEELRCEEAVLNLAQCCPGLETRGLACESTHEGSGCSDEPTFTSIAEDTAICLRDKSCADLVASKTCDAVMAFAIRPYALRGADEPFTMPGVCP